MTCCKMIRGGEVIDVGNLFLCWVSKNHILAYCDANGAEYMQSALDDSRLYHAYWLRTPPADAPAPEEVELEMISQAEFDELYELLSGGETVEAAPEPEPVAEPEQEEPAPDETEKPMTVQQMRDKIAELEATIEKILKTIE